jgi:ABC-type multidrug transport system fused ATPase/permease subunit
MGAGVSLGLVITFLTYVQRFNQPVQQISILWTNLQNAIAGGERIFSLLDTEPDIQEIPGASELTELRGEVEFRSVSASASGRAGLGMSVLKLSQVRRLLSSGQPGQERPRSLT